MHKVPNILSSLRIVAIPLLVFFIILSSQPHDFALRIAFSLYVFAALTDWFDGFLARKYNYTSDFGSLLDGIADKLFVVSVILALVAVGYIEGWHFLAISLIILRELIMPAFRQFLGDYGIKIHASPLGRLKATIQMLALGLIILTPYGENFSFYGLILLWIATILTLFSAFDYFHKGFKEYNKISKH